MDFISKTVKVDFWGDGMGIGDTPLAAEKTIFL
jgi:hypothetical protein